MSSFTATFKQGAFFIFGIRALKLSNDSEILLLSNQAASSPAA